MSRVGGAPVFARPWCSSKMVQLAWNTTADAIRANLTSVFILPMPSKGHWLLDSQFISHCT